MHRVLELGSQGVGELAGVEQGAQHLGGVAVAFPEGPGHAVDQGRRRVVADEEGRQLLGDVVRGRRLAAQDVQRLFDLGKAGALDLVAEEDLVPEVVPLRIEHEIALADVERLLLGLQLRVLILLVDPHAGQDARQFLHILLGIARAHPHGVQLHDFAGVVLVDLADGVLVVVQEAQHGRVPERRFQEVAEPAQRMGPDRRLLVVAEHGADVLLAGEDAEVVEPEPGHLFLELGGRIDVAQEGLLQGVDVALEQVLLVSLLLVGVGHRALGRGADFIGLGEDLGQGLAVDLQLIDPGLDPGWQPVVRGGMQLPVEPPLGPQLLHLRDIGRRRAPGDAVQQHQVVGRQGRVGRRRRGQRRGCCAEGDQGCAQSSGRHVVGPASRSCHRHGELDRRAPRS